MALYKTEEEAAKDPNANYDQELDITHIMTIPAETVVAYQVMELLINNKDGVLSLIF